MRLWIWFLIAVSVTFVVSLPASAALFPAGSSSTLNPCKLITQSEAAKALGEPVTQRLVPKDPVDRQRAGGGSQRVTGPVSSQARGWPSRGHRDRGRTTLRSRGQRAMHTLRNDPTHSPTTRAQIVKKVDDITFVADEGGCRSLRPR